jgi:NitT/TauT family transport system ATP-binding protein
VSPEVTGAADGLQLAVRAQHLSKAYNTQDGRVLAVDDINFEIADREFVAIVGPSGCGKTTILKVLAGLVTPSSGEVEVFGQLLRGPPGVGMVFQAPVLLKWRSVLDNVLFPIEILHKKKSAYREQAVETLRLVGLQGFENRYPWQLSGGMQQRVAIARALIHDPKLLLMDEPFGALDQITREQMNLELLRIWSETHKTTVLITHSISEAVFLADHVIVMTPRPGRIAGILDVVLPRPRSSDTKFSPDFIAAVQEVERLIGIAVA